MTQVLSGFKEGSLTQAGFSSVYLAMAGIGAAFVATPIYTAAKMDFERMFPEKQKDLQQKF